jgi:hypothetical protein
VQVLSAKHTKYDIRIRRCPISGAKLHPTDENMNLVYMLFQMNSGMGKNLQGGYRTAQQVPPTTLLVHVAMLHVAIVLGSSDKVVLAG